MAIEIIVEDGSIVEGANSDFSLEELDAYYETHLYPPTFTDAEHKKKAAVTACRILAASFQLKGAPRQWDQPRPFPRVGVMVPMDPAAIAAASGLITGEENVRLGINGAIPSNVVPQGWKDAAMEFVRFVVARDRDAVMDKPAVVREKIDVIEREFTKIGNAIDLIPEIVQRMVKPFVISADDQGEPGARVGVARAVPLFRA